MRVVKPKVAPVKGCGGEYGLVPPPPMPSRWAPKRPEHPAPLAFRVIGVVLLVAVVWTLFALA